MSSARRFESVRTKRENASGSIERVTLSHPTAPSVATTDAARSPRSSIVAAVVSAAKSIVNRRAVARSNSARRLKRYATRSRGKSSRRSSAIVWTRPVGPSITRAPSTRPPIVARRTAPDPPWDHSRTSATSASAASTAGVRASTKSWARKVARSASRLRTVSAEAASSIGAISRQSSRASFSSRTSYRSSAPSSPASRHATRRPVTSAVSKRKRRRSRRSASSRSRAFNR